MIGNIGPDEIKYKSCHYNWAWYNLINIIRIDHNKLKCISDYQDDYIDLFFLLAIDISKSLMEILGLIRLNMKFVIMIEYDLV